MHPIIRNPEAISDDEMPDPGVQVQVPKIQPAAQVQVPQMQPAAQVQVPQMQPGAQVLYPQVQPQAQVICPQVQCFRITQPNPLILKFTTGLAICTYAGC